LAQFTTAHIFCFQLLKYNIVGRLQDTVQTFSEGMMAVAVTRCGWHVSRGSPSLYGHLNF